ncbi:hypothetical protein DBV05_g12134, partial [Lasiodiplodia theobromae]
PSPGPPASNLDIPTLSLLHHWTLHTFATLSQDPDTQSCWRTNIPRIGFSFDFVLQGLLALSALHLAHLHPERHAQHAATSAWYWENALRGASAALASPQPPAQPQPQPHDDGGGGGGGGSNADDGSADRTCALYAFAVTSCFYTLARGPQRVGDMLVCVVASNDDDAGGGGATGGGAADWLILFRGVRSLVELAKEQVLDGPLAPLASLARRQLERSSKLGVTAATAGRKGEGDEGGKQEEGAGSAALRELRRCIDADEREEPNVRTYREMVDSLAFCFRVVEAEERRGAGAGALAANFQAFFWLYRISDDFVLCLQQRLPMAMVIYAHFVVLIKSMDWTWVIGSWPSHLMGQIYESLDEGWRGRLRWPMEQVGWQP